MNQPNKFLIDGIDRLGKSTLIENILQELGYHLVIHNSKPKKLMYYSGFGDLYKNYQKDCNFAMFEIINQTQESGIIFDRTHLGELVYAPLYRGYTGQYVFQYEKRTYTKDCRLILLTTSNFDILEDDGESFDFNKKVQEQQMFLRAFCKSSIEDKCIIDVHDGHGKFKHPRQILEEALKVYKEVEENKSVQD